jgi:hypothetical protein
MKYIYISFFLLSFIVGLIYFYFSEPEKQIIYIHPTPDNVEQNIYKDKSNSCYKYTQEEVECIGDISEFPAQI